MFKAFSYADHNLDVSELEYALFYGAFLTDYINDVETAGVYAEDAADAEYKLSAFRNDIFIMLPDGEIVAVLEHVAYGNFKLHFFALPN